MAWLLIPGSHEQRRKGKFPLHSGKPKPVEFFGLSFAFHLLSSLIQADMLGPILWCSLCILFSFSSFSFIPHFQLWTTNQTYEKMNQVRRTSSCPVFPISIIPLYLNLRISWEKYSSGTSKGWQMPGECQVQSVYLRFIKRCLANKESFP